MWAARKSLILSRKTMWISRNDLGIIDYERGAKLAGNGYWMYRGMGSRLLSGRF